MQPANDGRPAALVKAGRAAGHTGVDKAAASAEGRHMQLSGTRTYPVPRERVWTVLNDPQVLARTTPGIETLEEQEPGHYAASFAIKLGPVSGRFTGSLEVVDVVEPDRYGLVARVQSPMGTVTSTVTVTLEPADPSDAGDAAAGTAVRFDGTVEVSGRLAALRQRVFSGVARMFTNQFFDALGVELDQA